MSFVRWVVGGGSAREEEAAGKAGDMMVACVTNGKISAIKKGVASNEPDRPRMSTVLNTIVPMENPNTPINITRRRPYRSLSLPQCGEERNTASDEIEIMLVI